MEPCLRPTVEYPQRVPLKVIGRMDVLRPEAVAALILQHLGPQPPEDAAPGVHPRGAFVSYTFWVTLADETVELPLRQAIQALPGVSLQL